MADKKPDDAASLDVKKPSDATPLETEDLDKVSGGAFDAFIKINHDMLNPQPLPP